MWKSDRSSKNLAANAALSWARAAMYRTLIEMNPELEKLSIAKDLPGFSAAVCETLALRFEMMTEMGGAKPLIQRK